MLHPSLRYGGYHLFFLIMFIPLSLFLERFSNNIKNFDRKILIILIITTLIFLGRNTDRLIKEYKLYSYNPFLNTNYPIREDSFRIQKRINKMIKENKTKKIYNNRHMFFQNM